MRCIRAVIVLLLFTSAAVCSGCERSSKASKTRSQEAGAGTQAASRPTARCSNAKAQGVFTLGTPGPIPNEEEDQHALDVPFAIEVGGAARLGEGFAVAMLEPLSDGSHAKLAIVGADAKSGRIIDLGRVHGDAAPPRVASHGSTVAVVVPDADAAGATLRLAIIRDATTKPDVDWGFDVSEGWDESAAFDVALSREGGVIVFDRMVRGARAIHAVAFSSANPDIMRGEPLVVSPDGSWGESPQLAVGASGFWVAWLERVEARPGQDAGRTEDDPTLDVGPAMLKVRSLSSLAVPTGVPLAVQQRPEHIFAFDLTMAKSAVLAWRQASHGPGSERGLVHVAHVRPDGSMVTQQVEQQEAGVGVPVLMAAEPGHDEAWLVLPAVDGQPQLGLVSEGRVAGDLRSEPAIGVAEPLLRTENGLLLAVPRGRAVELSLVDCLVKRAP